MPKDGVRHGDGASAALEHRADDRPEQNDDADGTACVPETGGDGVGAGANRRNRLPFPRQFGRAGGIRSRNASKIGRASCRERV